MWPGSVYAEPGQVRRVFSTGVELALPGATVMEVRGGKVVRMTIYYNSSVMRLQT